MSVEDDADFSLSPAVVETVHYVLPSLNVHTYVQLQGVRGFQIQSHTPMKSFFSAI